MMGRRRLGVATALALLATAARADAPFEFALPIDCAIGKTCFVQNYLDTDASDRWRDFRCGPLTYDGHKGTDFRLLNLAAMIEGIDVLAAAGGRISRTRDGEPDINVRERGREQVSGRECGNGVVIDHGQGWETLYCHMKRRSIAVRPGERVETGTVLGQVGLSGNTEFPHLHFEVQRGGMPIDPFTATAAGQGCATDGSSTLWTAAVQERLDYRPSGILNAGFSTDRPARADIEAGPVEPSWLPADAPAIVFWVEIFGLREGDIEMRRLVGPAGDTLAETSPNRSDRNRATFFGFVGKRRGADPWPPGRYVGEFRLMREIDGRQETVLQTRREILVR